MALEPYATSLKLEIGLCRPLWPINTSAIMMGKLTMAIHNSDCHSGRRERRATETPYAIPGRE